MSELAQRPAGRVSALAVLAERLQIDPSKCRDMLLNTCFKVKTGWDSQARANTYRTPDDNELAALVVLANEYKLNPLRGEIYAFLSNGGIVPVLGVDSWMKIANSHPEFDGLEILVPPREEWEPAGKHGKLCPQEMTCRVYLRNRTHPIEVTEYLDEVMPWGRVSEYNPQTKRRETVESNPYPAADDAPWNTHPKRMLRHKTIQQAVRYACSAGGLHSEDEAREIIARRESDIEGQLAGDPNALVHQQQQSAPQTAALPSPNMASVHPMPTQAPAQQPVPQPVSQQQPAANGPQEQDPPPPAPANQPAPQGGLSGLAQGLAGQIMSTTAQGWLEGVKDMIAENPLLSPVERVGLAQLVDTRLAALTLEQERAEKAEKPKRTRQKKEQPEPPAEAQEPAPAAEAQQNHRNDPTQTPIEERHIAKVLALQSPTIPLDSAVRIYNDAMDHKDLYSAEGLRAIEEMFQARRKALTEAEQPPAGGQPPAAADRMYEDWQVLDKETGELLEGLPALKADLASCVNRAQVEYIIKTKMVPGGHRYHVPEAEYRQAESAIRDRYLSARDASGQAPTIRDWNEWQGRMQLS